MLSQWRLAAKFNLIFLLVFLVSILGAGFVFNSMLQKQAREVVANQARLMMTNALAVRNYTSKQIQPILPNQRDGKFVPETVPAFSAKKSFAFLKKEYPDFDYRESVLNPTNVDDRSTKWETTIINQFRKDSDLPEVVGIRDGAKGQVFYLARPLKVTAQSCLKCHSTPSVAPVSMIKDYGSKNGFGWKLHDTIGAQIVAVPIALPQRIARQITFYMMIALAAVLLLTLVILNLMLRFIVIEPVKKLAMASDEISKGHLEVEDLPVTGKDEIAMLSGSFNRMIRSLRQAIRLLGDS